MTPDQTPPAPAPGATAEPLAPRYIALWGAGFVTPGVKLVALDFFTADSGYDAEAVVAIAALTPGQTWCSSDFARHWVRRTGLVELALAEFHTGGGGLAFHAELPYAPGAYVMVTDGDAVNALPADLETSPLLIGAFNDDDLDGATITLQGRKGLNDWYGAQVGYIPDEDVGYPLPIMELVVNVAEMFYLHTYGDGEA